MCIFCLVCSAHAVICSSIRSSQQIEQSEYSDTPACFNCETWGGIWNRLRPCHSIAPIHSTCSVYFCFPAKKNRDQKREQFHHRRKWEMTHFRSSPNSFYAICGGNWGALDQWQLFKHVFLTFLLSPFVSRIFFFRIRRRETECCYLIFFSLLLFFRRKSTQRHKKNSTILSFSPIFLLF